MGRPKKEVPNHGNLYEVKVAVTETINGSTIRKSFYSPISKADARKQAEQYRIKQATGRITDTRVTFSTFADNWLETCKADSVAANTYEYTYKNSVKNHLIPYFGQYTIANIKPNDVQNFFNSKKSTSESLLHKLRITLNSIFEKAIDNDIIFKNPCKSVVMPRSTAQVKEKHAYSSVEARALVDYAKTVENGYSIVILLKTGVRRGELLGLRWIDVDLPNMLIHVRQAVKEANGAIEVGPPKTKMSVRDIPIDDETVEVLKNIPRKVIRYRGKNQSRVPYEVTNEYVVPDIKGNCMRPGNWVCRIYDTLMSDFIKSHEDISKLCAHELRHTYGTLLYKGGTDIYTIQKLMGHSDIRITTAIYVHNDIEMIKKAIKQDW